MFKNMTVKFKNAIERLVEENEPKNNRILNKYLKYAEEYGTSNRTK